MKTIPNNMLQTIVLVLDAHKKIITSFPEGEKCFWKQETLAPGFGA
jgi:hypothetical protein